MIFHKIAEPITWSAAAMPKIFGPAGSSVKTFMYSGFTALKANNIIGGIAIKIAAVSFP